MHRQGVERKNFTQQKFTQFFQRAQPSRAAQCQLSFLQEYPLSKMKRIQRQYYAEAVSIWQLSGVLYQFCNLTLLLVFYRSLQVPVGCVVKCAARHQSRISFLLKSRRLLQPQRVSSTCTTTNHHDLPRHFRRVQVRDARLQRWLRVRRSS